MSSRLKLDNHKGRGFSTKIFCVFFVISILTLIYFNIIPTRDLSIIIAQFPEINTAGKKAFVQGYRITISVILFFVDVILVGPFAYLSYFSDHIKPKRFNSLFNDISFFDIGIALALVFTINLASAHILILDKVSDIRLSDEETNIILLFNATIFVVWVCCALFKIYTYSPEQRKELSKYALRF